MKISRIIFVTSLTAASYGAYVWVFHAAVPVNDQERKDEKPTDSTDPKNKAVAEMAKYLEAAPRAQISAMLKEPSQDASPPQAPLLTYIKKTESSAWIAKMLAKDEPLSTAEEAGAKLLENPARSAEDIQAVLAELPEQYEENRAKLLEFTAKLARHLENPGQVATLMLSESQRTLTQARASGTAGLMPQAIALREYYRLERDPTKQVAAYKAAMDAQTDPEIRTVLERFEVVLPPEAPVAAAAPPVSEAPQESAREPAAQSVSPASPVSEEDH